MNMYTATVIKSGNSYALRIPKRLAEDAHLEVGQKVEIPAPAVQRRGNAAGALAKLQKLADEKGSMPSISDAAAWQRAIRDEIDPWHEVIRDTGR